MTAAAWEKAPSGAAAAIAAQLAVAVPEVETPRLRLRAPRIEDFAGYAEVLTGPRGRYVGGPFSRQDAFADFAQAVSGWLLRGYGMWSIERRADASLLGFLALHHEAGDPEPELGYLLLAAAEGQGYAQEAAEAARRFAYERLGFGGLVSYVEPGNARSIAVAERLGARRDAAARHPEDAEILVYRHPAPRRAPE